MTNERVSIWSIVEEISRGLGSGDNGTVDPKVDALISALSETIADTLPNAGRDVLLEGALAVRRALDGMSRIDETSPGFAAGQLAAAADLLGFAAGRAAGAEAEALASKPVHSALLSRLVGGALSNAELRGSLGNRSEEYVCRLLRELREAGLVTTKKRGRAAFNTLTPAGRLLAEAPAVSRRRPEAPPLTDLVKAGYVLNRLEVANDWHDGSDIYRLNVSQ